MKKQQREGLRNKSDKELNKMKQNLKEGLSTGYSLMAKDTKKFIDVRTAKRTIAAINTEVVRRRREANNG